MIQPIDNSDLCAMARWLEATIPHARKLRDQQRHDGASRSAHGVAQMVRTLRREQSKHGYFAELWFGDLFRDAERLLAEFQIPLNPALT